MATFEKIEHKHEGESGMQSWVTPLSVGKNPQGNSMLFVGGKNLSHSYALKLSGEGVYNVNSIEYNSELLVINAISDGTSMEQFILKVVYDVLEVVNKTDAFSISTFNDGV